VKSLWREPLVGFLVIAALIVWWEHRRSAPEPLVVDPAVIDRLVEERELVLERPLTAEERDAVTRNFIDQEILLREALRLGLHLSDGRVRHRLSDKMMFLVAEEPPPPTDAQLDAYYLEHKSRYMTERMVSFEHRFYGDDESAAAQSLKPEGSPDMRRMQFFWLGYVMRRMTAQDMAGSFGPEFASALEGLPEKTWSGPVKSIRGWHLVRVTEWHPSEPIPREHLQERLRMEWLADRRDERRAEAIDRLRENYDIEYQSAGE